MSPPLAHEGFRGWYGTDHARPSLVKYQVLGVGPTWVTGPVTQMTARFLELWISGFNLWILLCSSSCVIALRWRSMTAKKLSGPM